MKRKIKNFIFSLLCITVMTITAASTTVPAYCAGPIVADESSEISGTDVIDMGIKAIDTATGKLTAVAMSLFPFALILLCILLLVAHNEKKVAGIIWLAGTVCAATFVIIIVNNGTALDLIKEFAAWMKN